MSDAAVLHTLDTWGIDLPVCRDTGALGRDLFGIEEAPTSLLLESGGCFGWFEHGAASDAGDRLLQLLKRLDRSGGIGVAARSEFARRNNDYRQAIHEAAVEVELASP